MAASLPGQMPYAASPLASEFDAQQNAALRQRRMADLLQQQMLQPDAMPTVPGAKLSPWSIAAKAMQGGLGGYMGSEADKADAATATGRQEALTKLLGEMPQGTPAVPENAPVGVGMEPGVGPTQPAQAAVPASPQEMAAYGAKFLPLGPAAAKVGEQFTNAAVGQMLPKTLSPEVLAELKIKHEQFQQTLQQRADEAKQRSEDRNASIEQRRDAAAENAALRREIASGNAALRRELHASGEAGEKGNLPVEGASLEGNPVVRNTKTGIAYEVKNGVPDKSKPYIGAITPKTEQAKGVAVAEKGEQGLKDMQTALDAVTNDSALYGKRATVGALLPGAFGMGASAGGLSEDQLSKKSQIASMTADITHSLYGSAFSAGEQARAKGFLIDPLDSTTVVKAKLKGRMALEREHVANLPASAKAAATARQGGAAPTAGGDDAALLNKYGPK